MNGSSLCTTTMLRSEAFKTLEPNSKAVLIDVWQRHNGMNNGQISYAIREAKEIGLSKDQAARAIEQLLERGFISCTRESAFNVKTRMARLWRLTGEPCTSNGMPATRDFMKWSANPAKSEEPKTLKIKRQSHQRDTQSHQRDRDLEIEIIEPLTVAPARPSAPKTRGSQSHQRDTSSYHVVGSSISSSLAGEEQQPRYSADPSLWLRLLASSQKACFTLIAPAAAEPARDITTAPPSKRPRTASRLPSKKLAPTSLSKIGAAA